MSPLGSFSPRGGEILQNSANIFLFVGKIWWLVGNPDKLTLVLPRMKLAEFCFGTGGGRWVWLLPGPKAAALRQRPVRRCEGTTASPCSHRDSTGLVSLYPTLLGCRCSNLPTCRWNTRCSSLNIPESLSPDSLVILAGCLLVW